MNEGINDAEILANKMIIDRVAARNILRILGAEDYAKLVKIAAEHPDSGPRSNNARKLTKELRKHKDYAHLSEYDLTDVIKDHLVNMIIVSAVDRHCLADPNDRTHPSWNGQWPKERKGR